MDDQDLEIMRGDDERLKAVIDPYTAAAALYFMAKKSFSAADNKALISKQLGSGITITVPGGVGVPAEAQIAIDKADTQALGNKEQDLYYNLTDGANHTLAKGKLKVLPEVRLAG